MSFLDDLISDLDLLRRKIRNRANKGKHGSNAKRKALALSRVTYERLDELIDELEKINKEMF